MRLAAYRIVKRRWSGSAFDGEGARLYGGRWNSPGTAVVYAASTRSLALLEILVHCSEAALKMDFVAIEAVFDSKLVETLGAEDLPRSWQADPAPVATRRIGDRWAERRSSPVLALPSSIVPEERNYLLNPGHPHFSRIEIGAPRPFAVDDRLA